MENKCIHCGAEIGLHQFETNKCPANGIENNPEYWMQTTFELPVKKMTGQDWDKIQKYLHKMETVEEQKFANGEVRIKGHPKLAAVREALNWLARNYTLIPKR